MPERLNTLVWAAALAAVIGFFLPWATLDINTTKAEHDIAAAIRRGLGKSFSSTANKPKREPAWTRSKKKSSPMIPSRISGYQVPYYANRRNVPAAMGLVELVTKRREAVGRKSYAVYALPVLAMLSAWLLSAFGERRWAAVVVALACGAVSGIGLWTLATTDTRTAYAFAVGSGLWLSLGAHAVLALTAAAVAVPWPLRTGAARRIDR